MNWKYEIRMYLRRWGIDLSRFNVAQSEDARLLALLTAYGIDTVLDVGANDGGYARQLLGAGFNGRILSFEPQATAHRSLLKSLETIENWDAAPRMALGDSSGTVELNIAANSASSSILPMLETHLRAAPQSRYIATERVPVFRLDNVDHSTIREARKIYLKIDTQGYETQVLSGSRGLMPRVQGLQLEMSLVPLYDGQVIFRDILDLVSQEGFELMNIVPGFSDVTTGRLLQIDGIFFKP